MKNTIIIFSILITGFSCKRNLSRTEVEDQLKEALRTSLYKGINNDSSRMKFTIKTVTYFEDETFYECEFMVLKQYGGHDTTGLMGARISKDFSTVKRKF